MISVGVLSDCEGGLNFLYEPTLAGAELALIEHGAKLRGDQPSDGVEPVTVAGKEVRLMIGCASSSSSSAVDEARRLVEREDVDILVGPEFIEAYAVKKYAARTPAVTFVGACCSPQTSTLRNPAPNYFSFAFNETQVGAGLGTYAFRQGWRQAVIIGPDEALGWGYAAGIVREFCALGGRVVKRIWVSPMVESSALVEQVPRTGIDGIFFLTSSGPQLFALLKELPLLKHGLRGKVIGQATVFVDFSRSLGKQFDGAVFSAAGTNSNPNTPMAAYMARHAKAFPKLLRYGRLTAPAAGFGLGYYNGMNAVLEALDETGGDLSHGQRRFRAALARVELDAPNGHLRLDSRRQVIGPNSLNRLTHDSRGRMRVRTFLTFPDVDQTFDGLFTATSPPPGRNSPACKRDRPPAWARS